MFPRQPLVYLIPLNIYGNLLRVSTSDAEINQAVRAIEDTSKTAGGARQLKKLSRVVSSYTVFGIRQLAWSSSSHQSRTSSVPVHFHL